MPSISNKHRQIGNKKGSVNIISDTKLLGDHESQYSAGQSREQVMGIKGSGGGQLRDHRNSAAPRIISRVRGEKVMQAYPNPSQKNS